jgi:hypothetical protein
MSRETPETIETDDGNFDAGFGWPATRVIRAGSYRAYVNRHRADPRYGAVVPQNVIGREM